MASTVASATDRRTEPRWAPEHTQWDATALLRPGLLVRVIDLSGGGVLLECSSRLRPGTRAELHLSGPGGRCVRGGRVQRCVVADLNPLRYRGALVFDQQLRVGMQGEGGE